LFIRYQFTTGAGPETVITSIYRLKYGFTQKEKKSEDRQAQTPQTHEGKPPQEAFAIQILGPKLVP
jgi:hypothetical protein